MTVWLFITSPTCKSDICRLYNTPGYAFGVCKAGSNAYVADYYYGLRKLNVTNPQAFKYWRYFTPSLITMSRLLMIMYMPPTAPAVAVVDVGGGERRRQNLSPWHDGRNRPAIPIHGG